MAERIIANLTLDTYQRNKILPLVIPQHDYGARYIRVRITEQGENVSVASGSVVSIIAKRMADGESAAFSGSVNADGSVLVPVTQWMLDAPSDDVDCHVAVTGTGYQYSTTSFVISPQERENPSYLEEDDPRVNIVEEALIKVVEEADRAEEQANLAASNARAEVEKLVGELGVVQETGVSITSVMSQGASSRSFANAIKGEESGGAVLCEDVSPVLHPVVVEVKSGNIIPPFNADYTSEGDVQQSVQSGGHTITLNGTASGTTGRLDFKLYVAGFFRLEKGKKYTLKSEIISGNIAEGRLYINNSVNNQDIIGVDLVEQITFTADNDYTCFAGINTAQGEVYENTVVQFMLNEGEEALPFTPFVPNGTAVKVTSAGANLAQPSNDLQKWGCSVTIASDDKITLTSTSGYESTFARVAKILLKANTEYTISLQDRKNIQYAFLWKEGETETVGGVIYTEITYTPSEDEYVDVGVYMPDSPPVGTVTSFYLMVNEGSTALPHEPYKVGQTIDTTVGSTIDLPSIAPYMSVYTDTEGTAVDVTYVKDTSAVVQKLVNAIVALGGNV